jgi:hypothetical protein
MDFSIARSFTNIICNSGLQNQYATKRDINNPDSAHIFCWSATLKTE